MAISSLGAATTVIIGLQNNKLFAIYPRRVDFLSAAALLTSATVTLFSVWEGFFDYRWLWIRYTATLGQLYSISDELDYLTADKNVIVADDKIDNLFKRLQSVASREQQRVV